MYQVKSPIAPTLTALLAAGALIRPAMAQGGAGKIAFESWQATGTVTTSRGQIGVMNADGSNPINISNNSFDDYNPSFNRTGSRIVFASDRTISSHGAVDEIYVMNSDGSNPTRVTNNAGAHPPLGIIGPKFSPDGSRIVFEAIPVGVPAAWEVYLINTDGTGMTRLTSNPVGQTGDMAPTFTPDGSKIVFERSHSTDGSNVFLVDLCEMNLDGSGLTVLTTIQGDLSSPAFSPDGGRIVFGQQQGGFNDIAVMNADGTGLTVLVSGSSSGNPSFSPDGSRIVFDSVPSIAPPYGIDEVYTMNADGSGLAQLTFGPGVSPPSSIEANGVPSWAPGSVGLPTLVSVAVNPSSAFPGTTVQGAVTLSRPAPAGGALVSLASNSSAVVPSSVTVPAGATSASFPVTTTAGLAQAPAIATASYDGVGQSAAVTSAPADRVSVTKAEYAASQKQLQVQANGSIATATMSLYVTSTGTLIGTMANAGGGKFQIKVAWPVNPANVTVRSSLGGSASLAVTAK